MARRLDANMDILGTCILCGDLMTLAKCGYANVGIDQPLCHTDSHSCYIQWTVHGVRADDDFNPPMDLT